MSQTKADSIASETNFKAGELIMPLSLVGAGTLGFPMLKSNTFSAPTSRHLRRPYSAMSRITELFRPISNIFCASI
jgi:hypothetical protein